MGMEFFKRIPSAKEIISMTPLPEDIKKIKEEKDADIRAG